MIQFIPALSDRIQQLTGINFDSDNEYSFFRPGGNDHLIQFFHGNIAKEFNELDGFSRHNVFLMELEEKIGIDFLLDDDNQFAVYSEENKKGVKAIQAVMDLRDEDIILIYYWGAIANCNRLNQKLCSLPGINPCYCSSPILLKVAKDLASLNAFQYCLEQLPVVFQDPITMKGEYKGKIAEEICTKFAKNYTNWFNIESISGSFIDGAQGTLTFHSDGLIHVDTCRLSSLLEIVSKIFTILKEKYKYLIERNISQENGIEIGNLFKFEYSPLEIELPIPIGNMENFAKQFANGRNFLQLLGNFERISPKLWSIKSTDTNLGTQIELELSYQTIRILLNQRHSLILADRIERFLRKYICAHLTSIAF